MEKIGFWLGKALSLLVLAAAAVLMCCLIQLEGIMSLFPAALLAGIGAALLLVTALIAVLTWRGKGKVRMSIGIVLAVLMIALLTLGNVYLSETLNTVRGISGGETETVHVGIYVHRENADSYSENAATLRYGILETVDRESTDAAIAELEAALGTKLTTVGYATPPELINALLSKQVDAIILNQAFYDMFAEITEYAEKMEDISEAVLKKIEMQITKPTQPQPDPTDPTAADPTASVNATEPTVILPAPDQKCFCVYISGIDVAGSVSVRSRSDVNILAVVNPTTRQILLLNTPRDYYVPLSISNGIPDKLTHAGNYGVQVSMDTLEMLYGIEIDYYFRVNFSGFKQIIDALGGVTVYSEVAFTRAGYQYVKGPNQLNGERALQFCRERYAFADGDHQRGRNQMALIKGVFDKVMSPALLTNYTQVLDAMEGSFKTSVPMELVGELVSAQLRDNSGWNIVSYSVSGTGAYKVPFSMGEAAWVMQPDHNTVAYAQSLIRGICNGETVKP